MTDRLVRASGQFLERRISRRGFVARAALVGTALTVAPVRFLTTPVTAWATVQPDSCPSGSACKGYSEFCCSHPNIGNFCPAYTFIGGWWKAQPPTGSAYCNGNARYYMDCNTFRQRRCDPDPGCFNNNCNCRKWCHLKFSYGNCNTRYQDGRDSYVVCRIIRCEHPAKGRCNPDRRNEPGCCSRKFMKDNATSHHGSCTGC